MPCDVHGRLRADAEDAPDLSPGHLVLVEFFHAGDAVVAQLREALLHLVVLVGDRPRSTDELFWVAVGHHGSNTRYASGYDSAASESL